MPRTAKPRDNYDQDTSKLMTLAEAIRIDPQAEPKFKQESRGLIYKLSDCLTRESQRREKQPSSKKS